MSGRSSAQGSKPPWKSFPFAIKLAVAQLGTTLYSNEALWALNWSHLLALDSPWSVPRRANRRATSVPCEEEIAEFLVRFYKYLKEAGKTDSSMKRLTNTFQTVRLLGKVEPGHYVFPSYARVLNAYFEVRKNSLLPPTATEVISRIRLGGSEDALDSGQGANQAKLINELGLQCINGRILRRKGVEPTNMLQQLGILPSLLSDAELVELAYWWLDPDALKSMSSITGNGFEQLERKLTKVMKKANYKKVKDYFYISFREFHTQSAASFKINLDGEFGTFTTLRRKLPKRILSTTQKDEAKEIFCEFLSESMRKELTIR